MVVIFLAGCTGSEATPVPTVPPASAAQVSDTAGSVTGIVLTDEMLGLPGAEVGVSGPTTATTQTDAEGKFTFNDLDPGSYVLTAARLGYETVAKRVTVVAGETVEATLTLEPIMVLADPWIDYKITDGYINGPNIYSAAVIYYSTPSFELNVTRGAQDVVASMSWNPSAPMTARYMRLGIGAPGASSTDYKVGESPLTHNVTEIEVEKDKAKVRIAYSLYFRCGVNAQCFLDHPNSLVPVVVYEQRVKIYTSIFYSQSAPEGYTGLP